MLFGLLGGGKKQGNSGQQQAIQSPHPRILVSSCPGAGKTYTLTKRIARLLQEGVHPSKILAITFTVAAAKAMKERLAEMVELPEVVICTFHSLAFKLLRQFGYKIGVSNLKVADENDVIKILAALEQDYPYTKEQMRSLFGLAKARLEHSFEDSRLSEAFGKYNEALRAQSVLDFDDLLLYAYQVLQDEAVKSWCCNAYEYLLVDEAQDTNPVQMRIVKALESGNVFLVGDQMQSIYGWRAAEPKLMRQFQEEAGVKHIILDINYRSYQPILNSAFALIKHDPDCLLNKITAERSGGEKPKLIFYKDELAEAKGVVGIVKRLLTLKKTDDIAILYRLNRLATRFQQTLFKNKIPYKIKGGQLINSPFLRPIMAFYQVIATPQIKDPWRTAGWYSKMMELDLKKIAFSGRAYHVPISLLRYLRVALHYDEWLKAVAGEEINEVSDDLDTLVTLAQDYRDHRSFLNFLNQDSGAVKEGVTLSTVHAAKGLEWPIVFVVCVEDGIIPHKKSISEQEKLDEERRLLYVAMTRAEDKLFITSARERRGQAKASRFITDLAHTCTVINE